MRLFAKLTHLFAVLRDYEYFKDATETYQGLYREALEMLTEALEENKQLTSENEALEMEILDLKGSNGGY